ncbi:restriction endonuclease subunit S [Marinilabilia salmonicolor]|jgi:type I restriction enzyme S subunit|uniref:Type I restriction enzyme S subunit n=1 Tax=Marinilabilia salmonicolor TaxID=989 RepID=A0A368URG3_9BACT|nr:restriction endonuclease subunit S [Marinilabilia salmonicolor]RCW31372.1 type I restriction enzyme S subunit [Marinilabilia salmonicolor]
MKEDWVEEKLGNIFFTTSGGTPSRRNSDNYKGNIPWVKSGELEKGIIYDTEEKISQKGLKNSSAKLFPKGTLLIALYGATIGKLAFLGIEAATNQAICGIFKNENIKSEFLFYFLKFKKQKLISQATGGAQPNISQSILKRLEFPLPPLPIQRAIVTKIENLFASLDKGIEDLTKAREQLKVYRQAVLKKAFGGELTKEWREKQNKLPTAEELFDEITIERQNYYEQQIKNWEKDVRVWEENKKESKKPSSPKKFKMQSPLTPEELSLLPELPKDWSWVRTGDTVFDTNDDIVDGPFGSNLKNSDFTEDGVVPVIGISNIDEGFKTKIRYVTKEKFKTISRSAVFPGNIIVAKIGSSYGKTGIYPEWMPTGLIPANLLRINPSSFFKRELLVWYLNSFMFKRRLDMIMKSTAQPAFNVSAFKHLPIPFMSKEEQHQIVRAIESRLSVCDKLEQSINEGLEKAEALRQSILKKAFEGKLLSETEIEKCKQEADYEPASVLLERIQKEKKK